MHTSHKCMHPRRLAYFLRQVRLLIEVLELKGLGQTSVGPVIWPLKTGSKFAHIFCHIKYMFFDIWCGKLNISYISTIFYRFSPIFDILPLDILYLYDIIPISSSWDALSDSGWFASSSWIWEIPKLNGGLVFRRWREGSNVRHWTLD